MLPEKGDASLVEFSTEIMETRKMAHFESTERKEQSLQDFMSGKNILYK